MISAITKQIMKYNINCLIFVFFIFCNLVLIRYHIKLLDYREWGDESDTIVVAKMIASGMKLYSEVFNLHGPLVYLPGVILEKFGEFGIRSHRVFIAASQIACLTALYFSPLLKHLSIKTKITYVTFSYIFILVFLQKCYSNTYTYQNMAAIFISMIMSQYTLPSILSIQINRYQIFFGNFLISCLSFVAIIYLPISIALFFCSANKNIKKSLSIIFLGITLNILVLIKLGSIKGYFVDHFYMNYSIMPLFNAEYWPITLVDITSNLITSLFKNISGAFFLLWFLIFTFNYFSKQKIFKWDILKNPRLILLLIGIWSLTIRGVSGSPSLPYYYAQITLLLLIVKKDDILKLNYFFKFLLFCFFFLIILKTSLIRSSENQLFKEKKIKKETEFSKLVKKITDKNDRIIAYSFQNFEYIASKRLPASGYSSLLPMNSKYNENPIIGVKINHCDEIESNKPKIMLIDKYNLWGKFPWETYGGCVDKILNKSYTKVNNMPFYIRNDIFEQAKKDSIF